VPLTKALTLRRCEFAWPNGDVYHGGFEAYPEPKPEPAPAGAGAAEAAGGGPRPAVGGGGDGGGPAREVGVGAAGPLHYLPEGDGLLTTAAGATLKGVVRFFPTLTPTPTPTLPVTLTLTRPDPEQVLSAVAGCMARRGAPTRVGRSTRASSLTASAPGRAPAATPTAAHTRGGGTPTYGRGTAAAVERAPPPGLGWLGP